MKILIAPLNWGLGHATRCMPIIEELRRQGAEVILASDGAAFDLLEREYPDLPIHLLPAYDIHYPFRSMVLSMAIQMPKILRGAIGEHFWLKKFLKNTPVDVVISDNRYGFFSRQVRSIFMTHQVNILIPMPLFQPIVNWVNHFFIKRFDACWIPDFEDKPNLAGVLSHGNFSKKLNIKYLGALSRFESGTKRCSVVNGFTQITQTEQRSVPLPLYSAAIVLSGPEPQRTVLEKKILLQLSQQKNSTDRYILIRGTAAKNDFISIEIPHLEIYDVLTSTLLNQKILESAVVICRSGYSSIMDLVYLQKAAILIPTPGQTEQEYLATELMRQNQFFSQTQADFNMQTALAEYQRFKNFRNFDIETETIKEIIRELLKK